MSETKATIEPGDPREELGGLVLVSGNLVVRFSLSRDTAKQLADKLAKLLNYTPRDNEQS